MEEKSKQLAEKEIYELWYLYESESINDLSDNDIKQINAFIKSNPEKCKDMWEIE